MEWGETIPTQLTKKGWYLTDLSKSLGVSINNYRKQYLGTEKERGMEAGDHSTNALSFSDVNRR